MPAETLPEKIGPYQIVGLLGRGGMGAVYKAYKPPLVKRFVAVKIVKSEFTSTPGALDRFRREAALAAELKHPNIVTVYDYEEVPDGDSYIVTELIEGGQTLKDRLLLGSIPLAEASDVLKQVASALDYAYDSHHIVHRDIKPSNIFIDGKRVALGDFGIAKDVTANTQLTSFGEGVGTPDYMSPEQAMGELLDRRSDIYSLGIMAFEMVTGSVPFKGDTPISVVMGHIQKPVPTIRSINPNVPVQLENVINKALSKKKEDRYQSAGDFAQAFEAAASGLTSAATAATVAGGYQSAGQNYTDTLSSQNEANSVSQGLNLVAMLESQGRFQEAFDQLNTLHLQHPQSSQISSRHQAYVNQGYISTTTPKPSTGNYGNIGSAVNAGTAGYAFGNQSGYQGFQTTPNSDVRTVTPPPDRYTATTTTGGGRPPRKSSLPLILIGVGVLVVVAAIVGVIVATGKPTPTPVAAATATAQPSTAPATPTSSTTVAATTTPTKATPVSTPAPYTPGVAVAGPVKKDGYVIAISNIQKPDKDSLGTTPKSGYQFIALDVAIGSENDSGISANPIYASIQDADSHNYSQNLFNVQKPDFPVQNNIPKGTTLHGWLLFEVPQTATGLVFVYKPISLNNTVIQVPLAGGSTAVTTSALPANDPGAKLDADGQSLYNNGDYAGAADKFLQAVKLNPKSADYHDNLGRAYLELQKYDLAENEIRLALSLDPTVAAYHNNLGVVLDRQGKYQDAEQAYRDALKIKQNSALYHRNLAQVLNTEEKYTEAKDEANTAISLDPNDGDAYDALGQALEYNDANHYADAEKAYRKAVELVPNSYYFNADLASALSDQSKYVDAEPYARKAVSLNANYAGGHNALGIALEGQKLYQQAADEYRKATTISPKEPIYFRNLAHALERNKQYPDAQKAVETALTLDPSNARAHAIRGDIFYDLADYKNALTAYLKAVELNSNDAYYNVDVGDCYYQLKDNANAKKYYQAALKIDPNNADAQDGLKKAGG